MRGKELCFHVYSSTGFLQCHVYQETCSDTMESQRVFWPWNRTSGIFGIISTWPRRLSKWKVVKKLRRNNGVRRTIPSMWCRYRIKVCWDMGNISGYNGTDTDECRILDVYRHDLCFYKNVTNSFHVTWMNRCITYLLNYNELRLTCSFVM